jgi:hypothetical protein
LPQTELLVTRRDVLPLLAGICGMVACTPEVGERRVGPDDARALASGGAAASVPGSGDGAGGDGVGGDGGGRVPGIVWACAALPIPRPGGGVFSRTVEGRLSRVEMADVADTCFASPDITIGPLEPPGTPVLALRVVGEGGAWDVGMVVPGASTRGWTIGEEVELSLRHEIGEPDGYFAYVGLARRGVVIAAAADGSMDGVASTSYTVGAAALSAE